MSGSPFQSSSHQTTSYIEDSKLDRLDVCQMPRMDGHQQVNSSSRSPQHKAVLSSSSFSRVLNAPRPSLEINGDNVLFANRHLLNKHTKKWRATANLNQNNGLLNNLALHSTPSEHVALNNAIRASLPNMHRTSTPHLRHSFGQASGEDVLNSALIGAPRLALNQSLSSSVEEAGLMSNSNQNDFVPVAVSSFEEEPVSQEQDPIQPISSPPIQARQIGCTEAAVKKQLEISRLSTASNDPFRCRICLEEGDPERVLLSPCRCKGTVGLIHRHCLQRWIIESGKPSCELCGYAYIMTPSRRRSGPLFTQQVRQRGTFRDWLHLQPTRKNLLTDLICLILLTPSTVLGVYFCAMGAVSYSAGNIISLQAVGLWVLAILLFVLLTLWIMLAARHHWSDYQRYRYYQRRRAAEETERMASLTRWRFSIQPRPRGSSVCLHSLNDQTVRMADSVSCAVHSDSTRDVSTSAQFCTSVASEMDLPVTQLIPTIQTRQRLQSTSQQIVVSVALSAVPEVTEEYTTPPTNRESEDTA